MAYGASTPKKRKPRRGGGGCCGCLILVLALLVGVFFLARKWAPNHLNNALSWSRTQAVTKYPVLDRWLPQAKATPKPSVFEPPAPAATPLSPSATPEPAPTPAPVAAPSQPAGRGFEILSTTPAFTDQIIGTGAEAKLGQTVVVRYGAAKPTDAPETLMLGATEVAPELEAGIRGMKVGGKRKIGETEIELVKVL